MTNAGYRLALARSDLRRARRGQMKWRNMPKTLFLVLVLGHDGEVCYDCGWHYPISMWAPAPLWSELVNPTGGGLICAPCLNRRAKKAGIDLTFTPMVTARNKVPTTNYWLSDTRDWLMMGWPDPGYADLMDDDVYPTQWPWAAIKDSFASLMAEPVTKGWAKQERPPRVLGTGTDD